MFLFNENEPAPFRFVHPSKLEKIKKLATLSFPDYVRYLLLFGSSLNLCCSQDSDTDLYFIVDDGFEDQIGELHILCRILKSNFDLLVSSEPDFRERAKSINSVEHDIAEEGVILYERKEKSNPFGQS